MGDLCNCCFSFIFSSFLYILSSPQTTCFPCPCSASSFPFPHLWFGVSTSSILTTANDGCVGWSNKEGSLLSWVFAHIIFMPGHLCANYLMAAHILVNNNLDNLKKIIPGYRCYLLCWMAIKNNREENCCQSGLLCAKNEFLLVA